MDDLLNEVKTMNEFLSDQENRKTKLITDELKNFEDERQILEGLKGF